MERRPNTLKGNLGFLILFLLLGAVCSLRFDLTELIRMDLYPIPLMIVVYLGYKLGRKAGLIAGLICNRTRRRKCYPEVYERHRWGILILVLIHTLHRILHLFYFQTCTLGISYPCHPYILFNY